MTLVKMNVEHWTLNDDKVWMSSPILHFTIETLIIWHFGSLHYSLYSSLQSFISQVSLHWSEIRLTATTTHNPFTGNEDHDNSPMVAFENVLTIQNCSWVLPPITANTVGPARHGIHAGTGTRRRFWSTRSSLQSCGIPEPLKMEKPSKYLKLLENSYICM